MWYIQQFMKSRTWNPEWLRCGRLYCSRWSTHEFQSRSLPMCGFGISWRLFEGPPKPRQPFITNLLLRPVCQLQLFDTVRAPPRFHLPASLSWLQWTLERGKVQWELRCETVIATEEMLLRMTNCEWPPATEKAPSNHGLCRYFSSVHDLGSETPEN